MCILCLHLKNLRVIILYMVIHDKIGIFRRKDLGLPEHVTLLPECEEDRVAAINATVLKARHQRLHATDSRSRRKAVMRSSIFDVGGTGHVSKDMPQMDPASRKRKSILDKARFVAALQQARPRKGPAIRVRRTAR